MLHKHTQKSVIYTRQNKGLEKADGSCFLYFKWNGAAGDVRFSWVQRSDRSINKKKKNWSKAQDVKKTMRQPWKKDWLGWLEMLIDFYHKIWKCNGTYLAKMICAWAAPPFGWEFMLRQMLAAKVMYRQVWDKLKRQETEARLLVQGKQIWRQTASNLTFLACYKHV